MPYLDAALAFALTMLAVSTLVTQIVRLFRNTFVVRKEGMQEMLNEYFTQELKPVVDRELNRLKDRVTDQIAAEVGTLAGKLGVKLLPTSNDPQSPKAHPLYTTEELEKLTDETTEDMIERLKRSDMGKKLLQNLGDKAQAVFDELGKRYEIVGKKATESFRNKSRSWATGIALVLALAVNIDSIHIANTYLKNEGSRQAVIAQKDAFVEDYNALAKTLEQEQGKETFTKEELEQAFKDSREQLNTVTSAGFPIGWSYFPHSYFQKEGVASTDFQNRNTFLGWLTWLLGVLLTGVLAGLGGPFWYDVVAGVSRVVQSTRAAAKKPEG